ncbi:phospholipase D-like domain-containing protein [Bacillus rubiinfantis]|uniref:phospholipase D-like domain-containing protein n=1 Tax=Bacillus rubiinfantis TaxID=1499680 RepID=UPI000694ADEF|nr:phospholipase D-like domain-containing protein [Bacillus rubiinfantis]
MFVCGAGFLLLIVWLVLDFRLGRKQHLSTLRPFYSPSVTSDFQLFSHGKELIGDYFATLRRAETEIDIMFYIVRNDQLGQEFFSILKEKALEGVHVQLLLDRLGSLGIKKRIIADLRQAGVQVAFSNPVRPPFLFYSAQARNHRKISVIDGKIGYLGGFNIGLEYIDQGPAKLTPWRDYHVKMTGEGVAYLLAAFHNDWQKRAANAAVLTEVQQDEIAAKVQVGLGAESSRPMKQQPNSGDLRAVLHQLVSGNLRAVLHQPESGRLRAVRRQPDSAKLQTVRHQPDSAKLQTIRRQPDSAKLQTVQRQPSYYHNGDAYPSNQGAVRHQLMATEGNQLERQFIGLIRMAEQEIIIGTPYFIPSQRILNELLAAARLGVKLVVIVPFTADHPLVQEASYRYLRELLQAGAQVFQYNHGFYHAKTIVIDDKVCDIGTANFDKRSLYLNKEMNCYFYSKEFITQLKDVLQQDIHNSIPLKLTALNTLNPYRTLKEILARALSYFL